MRVRLVGKEEVAGKAAACLGGCEVAGVAVNVQDHVTSPEPLDGVGVSGTIV